MTLFDMLYSSIALIEERVSEKNVPNYVSAETIATLPNVQFGKTYYMPIKGALRAVRFETLVSSATNSRRYCFLVGTAAQLGKFTIGGSSGMRDGKDYECHIWNDCAKIYASPDDFEDHVSLDLGMVDVSFERIFKFAFGNQFDYVCSHPELKYVRCFLGGEHYKQDARRYEWDGVFVVKADNPIVRECSERIEVSPDGYVLIGNSKKTRKDFADYFAMTYPTISACKADNEVLVLDFEETQPQQQRELHVTISVTPDMLPKIVSIGAVVVK